MKLKVKKRFIVCLLIGCLGFGKLAWCAEKVDSADQALEQLRLLQKRLGTQSSSNASAAAASEKPSTPPARKSRASTRRTSSKDDDAFNMTPSEEAIMDDLALSEVKKAMFPLSPKQTIEVKKWYENDEYAQASSASTPPKPTATSQMVNLSPGSTPPVIRLSQGFVSSLVFLDSTGAPWPIVAYDLGDPNAFNIQWDRVGNTLMIQASKLYTYGNLAVRLRGLNTPVMLTLIPGQKAVDYRVDLRVQGHGPNAKQIPMDVSLPSSSNDVLLHVLDGVPPSGSTHLTVSGGDAEAWLLNNKMFIRTSLTILSPGWLASMTSADGTHAYEMQKSPVLLVSWHGKVMQLKVEGL